MWHSVEYVCLSRIKLVLRVMKEILHAFQWAVLHTKVDSKWASTQKGTDWVLFGWYSRCHFFAPSGSPVWWDWVPGVLLCCIMWGLKWSGSLVSFQMRLKHHYKKFAGEDDAVGFPLPNVCYQKLPGVLGRDGSACKSVYCRSMRTCVWAWVAACKPLMWNGRQVDTCV